MKKFGKTIVTWVMILSLLFSMLPSSFAVSSVDPIDDALVNQFVDSVFTLSHKDEFVNMLKLFKDIDDLEGIITAYTNAFGELAGSQKDRLESFGASVQAVGALARFMQYEEFSEANLNSYLYNVDVTVGKAKFKAAIVRRLDEFRTLMKNAGSDLKKLDTGFVRMDKIFGLLKDAGLANSIGISLPFLETPVVNGNFTLNRTEAAKLVVLANSRLVDQISSTDPVLNALQKFVVYYNGTSGTDRSNTFAYLNKYGFVKVIPVIIPPTPTPTPTPAPAPLPAPATTEAAIDIEDETNPLGLNPFVDLSAYKWALEAITRLFGAGVVKGKPGNEFDPNGAITRAEFSVMLIRLLDVTPKSEELAFSDFTSKDWFYKEVIAANKLGYVIGYGNQLFKPQGKITREEMATMIARVLLQNNYKVTKNTALNGFADKSLISAWAVEAAKLVVQEGIIEGRTPTEFAPKGTATRAEATVMLYRLTDKIETVIVKTK